MFANKIKMVSTTRRQSWIQKVLEIPFDFYLFIHEVLVESLDTSVESGSRNGWGLGTILLMGYIMVKWLENVYEYDELDLEVFWENWSDFQDGFYLRCLGYLFVIFCLVNVFLILRPWRKYQIRHAKHPDQIRSPNLREIDSVNKIYELAVWQPNIYALNIFW